jgi:hypothetical protein
MCAASRQTTRERPSSGRGIVTGWEWYVVDDERAANDVARPSFVYRGAGPNLVWAGGAGL